MATTPIEPTNPRPPSESSSGAVQPATSRLHCGGLVLGCGSAAVILTILILGLTRPGQFGTGLFGVAVGWLTYWALWHQQADAWTRVIGGILSVATTSSLIFSTAFGQVQEQGILGGTLLQTYFVGFAAGVFLYLLVVYAFALQAFGTARAAAYWMLMGDDHHGDQNNHGGASTSLSALLDGMVRALQRKRPSP